MVTLLELISNLALAISDLPRQKANVAAGRAHPSQFTGLQAKILAIEQEIARRRQEIQAQEETSDSDIPFELPIISDIPVPSVVIPVIPSQEKPQLSLKQLAVLIGLGVLIL